MRHAGILPVTLTAWALALSTCGGESNPLGPYFEALAITASNDDGTHAAACAVDGNLETRWSCLGANCWLQLDLGEPRAFDAVEIAWSDDAPSRPFEILAGPDEADLASILSGRTSSATRTLEPFRFSPVEARLVRVVVRGEAQGDRAGISEIRVPVLGALDIRSITDQSGERRERELLDSRLATRWSCPGPTCALLIDLGEARAVSGLQLAWYRFKPGFGFRAARSIDGESFGAETTLHSSGLTRELESYTLPLGRARYVRLSVELGPQPMTALSEMRVTGSANADRPDELSADSTPPSITAPADVQATATGALTRVPLGTPVVRDDVDPSPRITNDAPADGFPVGTTTVTWRATDDSGNSATATQRVTIDEPAQAPDTTPPSITAPADVTRIATGTLTPVSLGAPVVRDDAAPSPTVTNDAPDDGFPVGTTTVTWRATDSSGNSATATQRVTINPATTPEPTSSTDAFGTRAVYPSAASGRSWHAKWDSNPRTLTNGQVDPQDPEFWMRGSSHTLQIFGDGTAKSAGETIRFYIGDRSGNRKWQNVELTMYSQRISEQSDATSTAGFAVETRTGDGHTSSTTATNDEGLDKRCDGKAYALVLRYDGRAVLQKELKHPTYTSTVARNVWNGGALPRNQWIGMKVITRNVANGVKLEIWRDLTDGANGGTWEKIHEHTDSGGWSIDPSIAASCNIAPDHIITTPEPYIVLRNDNIEDQRYKKVSVREIAP